MTVDELKQQLAKAQETVRALHEELAETNRGLMALTMELEQRVETRAAELSIAHGELKKTNSELLQLTLELEGRVAERTADLLKSNEALRAEMVERERAEALSRESDARYRWLFKNMLEGYAHCRMLFGQGCPSDFVYLEVNEAFGELTGLTDVIGKGVTEVIPGIRESNPELFEIYGRVALTGRPERFEVYLEALRAWLSVAVYSLEKGTFIAVFSNVTERKQYESRLEERVRQRTAQLEAANKELEAFSYAVSHDLRAPLRGIDGWSQALLEHCADRLDQTGREHLGRVRSETQRMRQLIEDMLQLSRLTKREMRLETIDLTALAWRIYSRLRESQPDRQVIFIVEPELQANGDRGLLEAALTNLLDNAWKFTRKRASAHIEFGRAEKGGKSVFFVRDNGAGFDMAFAKKLFAPFQRMHRAAEFPGTGVGLATVQRIIHRHGGSIWAEAEIDKGACFYFTIVGS